VEKGVAKSLGPGSKGNIFGLELHSIIFLTFYDLSTYKSISFMCSVPTLCYTAKTKCRKFETNFPEKEYPGLNPNFHIHVTVSELYIPTMGLAFLLEEICGPILGIYKSLTDT
jgi:hypothetical protein